MRSGEHLSALITGWRQLPRDWIDFIETAKSPANSTRPFRNLEAEAARNWSLAQQRMATWLPKIAYFVALLVAGAMVVQVAEKVYIEPIKQMENALDNASK